MTENPDWIYKLLATMALIGLATTTLAVAGILYGLYKLIA